MTSRPARRRAAAPARALPRRVLAASCAALFAAALAGCGDARNDAPPIAAVPGTSVAFDLDADVANPAHFYDLPYPSDLRLDASGHPELAGFPAPAGNGIVSAVQASAQRRAAFPAVGAGYFRFDAPLAPREPRAAIPASADQPLLLVDVDPRSDERGRLFPLVASTLQEDAYAPAHLLAVAPFPGIVLRGERTYAYVVRRALGDASGQPLGVTLALAELAADRTPAGERGPAMREQLRPLWETLDALGIPRGEVAAATVFTTADVVADLESLSSRLLERYAPDVRDLALDPDDGAAHQRFCELHGTIRFPQFQHGTPPYDTDGLFVNGDDGLPVLQREEDAPVTITLPRTPMPAGGYPLVLYFHGSGGLSTQVVDRGRTSEPGGTPAKGEGPSHVVAVHALATASSALPLNSERLAGAGGRDYLNFGNLGVYADNFRQAAIEQRLLIGALSRLRIAPEALAGCNGPALPTGESAFRLRAEGTMVLGQSLGAQMVNMLAALDPRVRTAVPTGSGGLWSLVTLEAKELAGVPIDGIVPSLLGTTARVDHLHPAMQLLQAAFEPADPVVFAPRIARDPLPGHPVRSIYVPAGVDDPGFSNRIYAAMSLASGVEQAGEVRSAIFPETLALGGLDGDLPYPVADNVAAESGTPYTGVVVQYESDGILDAHHVFAQRDDVKHQYGCFFATFAADGRAVVPGPAPLGSDCAR